MAQRRRIYPQVAPNGELTYPSMTTTVEGIEGHVVMPPKEVIPVIFIPGVMGSRLKRTDEDTWAWYPPEGNLEGIDAFREYRKKDAAVRQRELDLKKTDVGSGPIAKSAKGVNFFLTPVEQETWEQQAQWRGWGEIFNSCYLPVLIEMEEMLNNFIFTTPTDKNKATDVVPLLPEWKALLDSQTQKPMWGAQKEPFIPLEEDDLKQVAPESWFPVHAVGYNWLKSNQAAAERLKQKINEWFAHYQNIKVGGKPLKCEKVILVTHSMGGVVARLATQDSEVKEKVLGVVHGVMPATGAPATYVRMRSGTESNFSIPGFVTKTIMGRDAAEMTAVLAQAPGPLELLPFPEYDPNFRPEGQPSAPSEDATKPKHWLLERHNLPDGRDGWRALGERDYMQSIYLPNDPQVWWRLAKVELINPLGQKNRAERRELGEVIDEEKALLKDFDGFVKVLDQVAETHARLPVDASSYHDNTYAFYAADNKGLTWGETCWTHQAPYKGYYDGVNILPTGADADKMSSWEKGYYDMPANNKAEWEVADDQRGNVTIVANNLEHRFSIAKATCKGDGTVPETSGATPTAFCKQIFRHEGKAKQQTSYSHQDAYSVKMCIRITLYSIVRIASEYFKK